MEWNPRSTSMPTPEEISACVGPKAELYRRRFERFTATGEPRFAFSWNWYAFGAGLWWYLYRKMYGWALVDFVLSFVLGWTLFVPLLWAVARGITGDYLYFRWVERKVRDSRPFLSTGVPSDDAARIGRLAREGGVHAWLPRVAIAVMVLLLLLAALFFGTLWEMVPPLKDLWRDAPGRWT